MPQLYEHPAALLKNLSNMIQDGWQVLEFDYHRERLILKREDDLLKAHVVRGRVEWVALTPREEAVLRGTDRFFVI